MGVGFKAGRVAGGTATRLHRTEAVRLSAVGAGHHATVVLGCGGSGNLESVSMRDMNLMLVNNAIH